MGLVCWTGVWDRGDGWEKDVEGVELDGVEECCRGVEVSSSGGVK